VHVCPDHLDRGRSSLTLEPSVVAARVIGVSTSQVSCFTLALGQQSQSTAGPSATALTVSQWILFCGEPTDISE
jgi:hypothetical protein